MCLNQMMYKKMRYCNFDLLSLTHWGLDKTAEILNISNEKFYILFQISLIFVPEGLIDLNLAMIMAWHRMGDNSLPEPMMTKP